MSRALPPLLSVTVGATLWALTACSPPPQTPQTQANAAVVAACRERADSRADVQERDRIYRPISGVNTPSSAGYAPGDQDRVLAADYAHGQFVSSCVRNVGTGAERSTGTPSEPPPPPQR